jgi:benzylsuccinate CoA-transferase BbsF subunit
VIRVESSTRPDVTRMGLSGRDYDGLDGAPDYNTLNLNKRSFQVDLAQPEGIAMVHRLVPLCDVVVDNFRPGVMSRFGLAPDAVLRDHPAVVVASSSGNGSRGPEALNAGLASIFAAVGGVSEQTGYPDAPPTLIGESPDFRSGNLLAVAILAALAHRDRTGEGQCIDLSSTEVMTALAPHAFLAHSVGAEPTERSGNRHPVMAPHGVYPCRGEHQWISVAVGAPSQWAGLCALLDRPEWVARYGEAAKRKADEDLIDGFIAEWTAARSPLEAFEMLQGAGVPSAPSLTNADLASDPHLVERGAFVDIEHPVIGTQHVPGAPWQLSDAAWRSWRHAPLLGEDNAYVLHELLGFTPDEVAGLGDVFR